MKYIWTIQKKSILDMINSEGVYHPNFKYGGVKCNKAYQLVLDSFNQINKCSYDGLVFGFAKKEVGEYFDNIEELYEYFMSNPLITDAFNLWNDKYVILKLQYNESLNMIPVDFNDFVQIIPPIWDINACNIIKGCINNGIHSGGYTLPSFTQVHIPFIKKENIVEVYENFDKINSDRTGKLNTFSLK